MDGAAILQNVSKVSDNCACWLGPMEVYRFRKTVKVNPTYPYDESP